MARTFRRKVDVTVTVSIAAGVSLSQAKREIKTRVNDLCGHYCHIEESDVRIQRITKCPN